MGTVKFWDEGNVLMWWIEIRVEVEWINADTLCSLLIFPPLFNKVIISSSSSSSCCLRFEGAESKWLHYVHLGDMNIVHCCKSKILLRFDVLTAVSLKIQIFWDVPFCNSDTRLDWWNHCDLSKRRELLVCRQGQTCQKAYIFRALFYVRCVLQCIGITSQRCCRLHLGVL